MKFKSILSALCLVLTLVVLTSCSGIHLSEMPATQDTVYGNGGVSVTKGDYIYYVNSYTSYEGLSKNDNDSGKVTVGAIYRTKLVNGEVQKDSNGNITNYEMVVSKIAGYEFTNLHIFDDYIYYATPNMEYGKDGKLNTVVVDFCRTKLDGTDTQIIYTAKNYSSSSDYEVYKIGSSVYLVVFEQDKLVKVEINNRIKNAVTLMEEVSAVMFPKVYTYEYSDSVGITGTQGYVYYTRNVSETLDGAYDTDSITGNVLGRVLITDGSKTERKDGSVKYELTDITNDYLFVVKDVDIYAIDASFPLSPIEPGKQDVRLTHSSSSLSVTNFYATKNSNGFIYCLNGSTYYVNNIKSMRTYTMLDSEISVQYDDANFAYSVADSKIQRVSLKPTYYNVNEFNLEHECTLNGMHYIAGDTISAFTFISQDDYYSLTEALDMAKFTLNTQNEVIVEDSNISTSYIDFTKDGEIYFFSKYTGSSDESQYYLKRVVINSANKIKPTDDDDKETTPTSYIEWDLGYKTELICVLDKNHKS